MDAINDLPEVSASDVEEITENLKEYRERLTIPIKISPERSWVAKQLQDLAVKVSIDTDISSFEVSWDIETCVFTLVTHSKDSQNDT